MLITRKLQSAWQSQLWGRFWFVAGLMSYLRTVNCTVYREHASIPWKTTKTCRGNQQDLKLPNEGLHDVLESLPDIDQHPHFQPYLIWWDCFVDDLFFLVRKICRPWSNKKCSKNDNLENFTYLMMSQKWRFQNSTSQIATVTVKKISCVHHIVNIDRRRFPVSVTLQETAAWFQSSGCGEIIGGSNGLPLSCYNDRQR